MRTKSLIISAILFLSASSSYAYSLEQALEAAKRGNAEAQFDVGTCYFNGKFVYKDDTQARYWLLKSAEQGNAKAQFNLAVTYDKNRYGPAQNPEEAAKWYRIAAEQGYPEAELSLAGCLREGIGVKKNTTEAANWYGKAASNGIPEAIFCYGTCFYYGDGVDKNYEEALKWYRIGSEMNDPNCLFGIGNSYRDGTGVEKNMLDAIKWWVKASNLGNKDAAHNIDFELNKMISNSNNIDSTNAYVLGKCYQEGLGITKDERKAYNLYEQSAKQDYAPAQYEYGLSFIDGPVQSQNPSLALEWLTKAANSGNTDALNALIMYDKKIHVPIELTELIIQDLKRNGVTTTADDCESIDLLFLTGDHGYFQRFTYNRKNPSENVLYTIPVDINGFNASIEQQSNLKLDDMFHREFKNGKIRGCSSDGSQPYIREIKVIIVLNDYYEIFQKWMSIARENKVANFIKTFDGKDVTDFNQTILPINGRKQGEVYFEWLDGHAYIDVKDINTVYRYNEDYVEGATKAKPLLINMISSMKKMKEQIDNKKQEDKTNIDRLFGNTGETRNTGETQTQSNDLKNSPNTSSGTRPFKSRNYSKYLNP